MKSSLRNLNFELHTPGTEDAGDSQVKQHLTKNCGRTILTALCKRGWTEERPEPGKPTLRWLRKPLLAVTRPNGK